MSGTKRTFRDWWYVDSRIYRAWVNRCWTCLIGDRFHR